MYKTLCESLKQSFEKNIALLDKLPIQEYIQKIEEFKKMKENERSTDVENKYKKNIITPIKQKEQQFNVILNMLQQSGVYVLSAEDDTAEKVDWFQGNDYTYEEVQKALKGTHVALYKKQLKDKKHESCIAHGGYTLLKKEESQSSFWSANTFFKVKDKTDKVRMIKRVPFFKRKFKNPKKAMDDLNRNIQREFLDSTGRGKTFTDLGLIPKVYDYFVCFSETWGDSSAADVYVVQDYVENAMGLDEYIKENKESLNKDALENIKKMVSKIIKTIYTQTDYRYANDVIQYNDFMCGLKKDNKTIEKLYLKQFQSLIHKDEELEKAQEQQQERTEREKTLMDKMSTLLSKSMRDTEQMQMDVAVMMMVNDNVLGVPITEHDIEVKRNLDVKTKPTRKSKSKSKAPKSTRKKSK